MKRNWLTRLLVPALIVGVLTALALPGKARAAEMTPAEEIAALLGENATAAGTIVTLTGPAEADEVSVPEGVTLDLAGQTLAVNVLAASGDVIDSEKGSGLIKIDKDRLSLYKDNPQFPIYDTENSGYRLFEASLQMTKPYRKDTDAPRLKGQYRLNFTNTDAYALLAQGNHGVTFTVGIIYGETQNVGGENYSFSEDLITAYGTQYTSKVFGLSFKNYPNDPNFADWANKELTNVADVRCCGVVLPGGSYGPYTLSYQLQLMLNGAAVKTETLAYGTELTAPDYTSQTAEGTWIGWPDLPETMPAQDLTLDAEKVTVQNIAIGSKVSTTYALPNSTFNNVYGLTNRTSTEHSYESTAQVQMTYSEDGYILFDLKEDLDVYGYRMDNYKYIVQLGGITEWAVYGSLTNDLETATLLDEGQVENVASYASDPGRMITDGINFAKPAKCRYIWLKVNAVKEGDGREDVARNIRLCEFQIWGLPGERMNVALASNGTNVYSAFKSEADSGTYTLSKINNGTAQWDTQNFTIGTWAEGYGNYYQFDFGVACDVDAYQIYVYRYATLYSGIKAWHIETSLDGSSWTTCASGTQNRTEVNESNYTLSGHLDTPVRARYLRLVADSAWLGSKESRTQVKLYEVKIFGKPVQKNLAKGATVTTTYITPEAEPYESADGTTHRLYLNEKGEPSAPMTKVVDGNPSTMCRYAWIPDGEIIFDLGQSYSLTGYNIYNYQYPYQWCINQSWTVSTSNDGVNWTLQREDSIVLAPEEIVNGVNYKTASNGFPDGGAFTEPVEARYVKLVITEVTVGDGIANPSNPGAYTADDCNRKDVRFYEFMVFGEE